ncbi:MAG: Methylthioribose-phosphate isomerase [Planctomycetota bacterium]|jgi:methylthioribose-1-phosphate isomerase
METNRPGPLPPTLAWEGSVDGTLLLLDQTRLPHVVDVVAVRDLASAVDAIRRLVVRGAPAIGVAAAYAAVTGVRERAPVCPTTWDAAVEDVTAQLEASRPTAVNLAWAMARIRRRARAEASLEALLAEARAIHAEDAEHCRRMGLHGAPLVHEGARVLTHCNAGRLATAGDGTALAVLFAAWRAGTRFTVLADETRPLLQGSRLTALELAAEGIPVEVLCDSAAPGLIARGEVDMVFTGADRIAANGDVANKVGTYGLALACAARGTPFHVVAPSSTFDLTLPDGRSIPIEERDGNEVLELHGTRIAAAGIRARNPAFDVTPAALVRSIVTDAGIVQPVDAATIKKVLAGSR